MRRLPWALSIALGLQSLFLPQLRAEEELVRRWGLIETYHGEFVVRAQDEPFASQPFAATQPFAASQPFAPTFDPATAFAAAPGFATSESFEAQVEAFRQLALSPTDDVVTPAEAKLAAPVDTGAILSESNSAPSTATQQRSPIARDPYIRGFRGDQVYSQADGVYWQAARRDLDSLLSKIDPSLIAAATVIPGPYGLRYGPGMAYVNVVTIDTPRYCNGYESHLRTGFTTRLNGGQVYGRETAFGGGADWGYILSWGIRSGADYDPGSDAPFERIPASYHSQNFLGQFGLDLSADSKVEMRYQRVGDNDVEYAGQIFDINFAATDAFSMSYTVDDPCNCSSLVIDSWYNFTRFTGDTTRPGKRAPFPVVDRIERALQNQQNLNAPPDFFGFTYGDVTSTGARMVRSWGETDTTQVRLGTDIRYIEQKISERFTVSPPVNFSTDTNMPRSDMIDPGIFGEVVMPWSAYWDTSVGGRLDWAHTRARANDLIQPTGLPGSPDSLSNSDVLYAFYVDNSIDLTPGISMRVAGGHAQRVPSLIDRYSDGVFLGLVQSGYNRVTGDPRLEKERSWQIDAAVDFDRCFYRGNIRAFHNWIDDYNLYAGDIVRDPSGARLLRSVNAELVTLAGVEAYLEMDITERVTGFVTYRYLQGRDRDIQIVNQPGTVDQPLYGIIPQEGQIGIRVVDPCGGEKWGFEFVARLVDNQNEVADLRQLRINLQTGQPEIIGFDRQFEETTPGFATFDIRTYWNPTPTLSIVGGIENILDRAYFEHLNLRLPEDTVNNFSATRVYSPGITPYFGIEWTY